MYLKEVIQDLNDIKAFFLKVRHLGGEHLVL